MGVYNYTKDINSSKLLLEIKSTLGILLDGTDGCICTEPNNYVDVKTTVDLSAEDKTTLDGIISAHSSSFPEGDFKSAIYLLGLTEVFTVIELNNLSKKAPSFTTLVQAHRFADIKILRDALYTAEEITAADKTKIDNLFSEQNINLENY